MDTYGADPEVYPEDLDVFLGFDYQQEEEVIADTEDIGSYMAAP